MTPPSHRWAAWAAWIVRHHRRILAGWALLLAVGLWCGRDLEHRLHGSVGMIAGGAAQAVDTALTRDFDSPYAQFLVITDPQGASPALLAKLQGSPLIRAARALPAAEDRRSAVLVGLHARSQADTEALVPVLRRWLHDQGFAGARVTGVAPMSLDIVHYASAESSWAERQVLPLTLAALVIAFGALGAALLPILSGLGAVTVTMGVLALIARLTPLSVYAGNIATMLGLGLGIDYALFLVARWRDERGRQADDRAALTAAIAAGTPAILVSAATVLLGLTALALVPAEEARGLGIGGMVVVIVSALAAVTLLPALTAAVGPWADAPAGLARWRRDTTQVWVQAVRRVLQRPRLAGLAALTLLTVMALPLGRLELGDPEIRQMPAGLESIRAIRDLQAMGHGGALVPVQLLVRFDGAALDPARVTGLLAMASHLRQDRRTADLYAVADPARGGEHLLINLAMVDAETMRRQLPEPLHALISRDGTATMLYVIPDGALSLAAARQFARELQTTNWQSFWPAGSPAVTVGGPLVMANEFIDLTRTQFPRLLAIVAGGTFLVLLAYTRSVLLPIKAVLANLLTVAAALGGTTALFQSPLGMRLLGLDSPLEVLPPGIPLVTFCIVFGLSMDYEIFLLSPMLQAHRQGDDDATAVIGGVTASAGVITAAAGVMGIVFFGFALTGFVSVKFLGVALGLGVLLDATVTRLVLIPAAMMTLGRWNWWPGRP